MPTVICENPGRRRAEQRTVPRPGAGDVLLRVRRVDLSNLGPGLLSEDRLQEQHAPDDILHAMTKAPTLVAELDGARADELLPVFDAPGRDDAARDDPVALAEAT